MIVRRRTLLFAAVGIAAAGGVIASGLVAGNHRSPDKVPSSPVNRASREAAPEPQGVPLAVKPAALSPTTVTVPPLPAGAASVPDDDLLRLSALVNLANAANVPPDKDAWRQAIPIAEQLQQGPCDCEQRNWLHHFVETGNNALDGAADQYAENAQLMRTLARNDRQAMELSHKGN